MGVSLDARIEAKLLHFGLEVFGIAPKFVHQLGGIFQQVDRRETGCRIGDGHRGGEQERASALPQPLDDDRVPRHHAADHAEGLGHRADLHIHFAVQAEVIHDAASAVAKHAFAVRVIHHQQDVVFLRDLVDGGQGRDVAVHAEHAVRDDQRAADTGSGWL